MKNAFY